MPKPHDPSAGLGPNTPEPETAPGPSRVTLLKTDDGEMRDMVAIIPVRVGHEVRELPVLMSELLFILGHLFPFLSQIVAAGVTAEQQSEDEKERLDFGPFLTAVGHEISIRLDYLTQRARPSEDVLEQLDFKDIGKRAFTEMLRHGYDSGSPENVERTN